MHDVWRCCWNFVESTCQLSESDGKWVCEPNACEHRLTYFFSCVGAIICWFLLLPTYFLFISFAVLQLSTLSDANGNASSRRRSTSTRSQFRDFFFFSFTVNFSPKQVCLWIAHTSNTQPQRYFGRCPNPIFNIKKSFKKIYYLNIYPIFNIIK